MAKKITDYTRDTIGKLFEGGDGVCCYHTPETMAVWAYEARKYNYRSICTSSPYVKEYRKLLEGTDIKIVGIAGYPYGDMSSDCKFTEIAKVIDEGCESFDMVVNMSYLKSGYYDLFRKEVFEAVEYARKLRPDVEIKMLVEMVLCNDEQLEVAARTVKESGADFIKTQTGWFPIGASLAQLKQIREIVGPDYPIKACGQITESIQGLAACLDAGVADIIGGIPVRIIEDLEFYQEYLKKQGRS